MPVHDDRRLFEFLVLEGAQAGLAWITILRKREGYRQAFAQLDPGAVARYGPADVERLVNDPSIVRNRRKIEAAISNARAFLDVQEAIGSFDDYIWAFVDGEPIINCFERHADIPAQTDLSRTISRDLGQKGFKFVGPTIVYAYMQATGMVNDHVLDCFRWRELAV